MKILVIGSGAREHALAWKLSREPGVEAVICAPGNPGISSAARCVPADVSAPADLLAIAESQSVDLTVVGPELPLSRGVVDAFTAAGRAIVGPTKAAAALEWSKAFAKDFMARPRFASANQPTRRWRRFAAANLRSRSCSRRMVSRLVRASSSPKMRPQRKWSLAP